MWRVLKNTDLRRVWEDDVKEIARQLRERILKLRSILEEDLGTPGDWKHVTAQVGMFT